MGRGAASHDSDVVHMVKAHIQYPQAYSKLKRLTADFLTQRAEPGARVEQSPSTRGLPKTPHPTPQIVRSTKGEGAWGEDISLGVCPYLLTVSLVVFKYSEYKNIILDA